MRRIAFIGIEHADSEVLTSALLRNLGPDTEIKVFAKDAEPAVVAPFLVVKEGGKLDGSNSVAYFSDKADEVLAKKVGKLAKVGVTVRNGWSDFDPEAEEEAVGQWLADGTWPEPEPEEDDVDRLLADLLADDEDDDEDEAAVAPAEDGPADPFTSEDTFATGLGGADGTADEQDGFPSRRFDSMSANEGQYAPTRRERYAESTVLTVPAVLAEAEEDDDLPVAFFDVPAAPAPVEDEDDLPLFPETAPAAPASAAVSEADEDAFEFPPLGSEVATTERVEREIAEPPSWLRGATRAKTAAPSPAPRSPQAADEDEDDLPLFEDTSSAGELPALDDDDDDLPFFPGAATAAPAEAKAAPIPASFLDEDDLPDLAPLAPRPTAAAQIAADYGAEGEDDLPLFRAPAEPTAEVDGFDDEDDLPSFAAPAAPSYAAPALSDSDSDDEDDDDLPAFPGVDQAVQASRAAHAAQAGLADGFGDDDEDDLPAFAAPAAPSYAAPARQAAPALSDSDSDDEGDGLPAFPGVASAAPSGLADGFGGDDEDDLPAFAAPAAPSYAAPARQAAPALSDSDDEDDDLPAFPGLSAAPTAAVMERAAATLRRRNAPAPEAAEDDGDDLPLPVQRTAPRRSLQERGEDLPPLAARAAAPEPENDPADEDEFEFSFAPKVQAPKYAAPAEKQPDWGMRVNPDEVRYENDNPQEVAADESHRRRAAEGYEQPVIPTDVHDRELKAAPGDTALRPATRVVNRRPATPAEAPVTEPEPMPFDDIESDEDGFDPEAPAPYMERLAPEARRAQSTMEDIRLKYDTRLVNRLRSNTEASVFYVTGSHGGAGKTTSTWMMANTLAAALKKDPDRPVFLIEGDYENSKLAQRLNLPPEKNSGKLAEVFRRLQTDRANGKGKVDIVELTENVIKESIYVNDHGVHIIAAPYDLTRRDGRFLRLAIQKSVEYAKRQGGYVFIDADTLSNDDVLDRTLAAAATHVVLVSFGDPDHVDDTHRAIHTLTTPVLKAVQGTGVNGMGVPKDRIKLFFNKTGTERFEDLKQVMLPYLVEGHLPTVGGLNDGGWIGNLTGADFAYAVTSYAVFLNRIHPMPELQPYQQRRPQKTTARTGFFRGFGRRR